MQNKIIITGRNKSKLENIKLGFPQFEYFQCDLTDKTSLNELVLFIEQHHSDLNILINNAGVQFNYNFTDEPNLTQKIDYEISANLNAPIKLTGLLLPLLIKNKNSAVVNGSSGLFIAPKKSAAVYCATKSAIHSFTKTLRYQLENTDTKVFEIIPSLIDTPMIQGRGKLKISPGQLADEFIQNLKADRFESYIGKTKLLKLISRLSPKTYFRMLHSSLIVFNAITRYFYLQNNRSNLWEHGALDYSPMILPAIYEKILKI